MTRYSFRNFKEIIGANAVSQLSSIALLLLTVPIFLHFWSLAEYGTWLALTALPNYLALADIGLFWYSSNLMLRQKSNGLYAKAQETFSATLAFLALLGILCVIISAAIWTWHASVYADTIAALILYTYLVLSLNAPVSSLRADGFVASSVNLQTAGKILDFLVTTASLLHDATFSELAVWLFTVRLGFTVLVIIYTKNVCPSWAWTLSFTEARQIQQLLRKSVPSQGVPLSQMMTSQGAIAVIALLHKPEYAAIYSVTRQASRLALQFSSILSNSVSHEFAKYDPSRSRADVISLFQAVDYRVAAIALALSSVFIVSASTIIPFWSNGKIAPDFITLLLVTLTSLMTALYTTSQIWLLSQNKFWGLSLASVLSSTCGLLGMAAMFLSDVGPVSVVSMLLGEIVLLYAVRRMARAHFDAQLADDIKL